MIDPAAGLTTALEGLSPHLLPVALAAARLAPVVYLAPTFGGRLLPAPLRVALALGLSVLVAGPGVAAPSGALAAAALVREAGVGLALGLAASLPFEMARAGGHVLDTVRGASLVRSLVPTLKEQASPTGDLLYLGLLALTGLSGGDRLVLGAVARSFAVLPAGAGLVPGGEAFAAGRLVDATAGLLGCALAIAAPAVVVALVTDLLLGVVGRVAPQLPLFFLGLPAKALLGLVVVALAAAAVFGRLQAEAAGAAGLVTRLAEGFAGGAS